MFNKLGVGSNWMDPIISFLKENTLPSDKLEVEKIRRKVPWFWLSEDQKLYKRSFSGPYLLCIHPKTSELLLEELHEGICRSHTGGRSLSYRAITQGYWWPNMQKEAQEYMKKCDQCQRFAPNIHQPGGVLNPLSSPWPFAQWGLDIVGPFPKQQVTRNICWSAQTISLSGLKLNLWRTSEMWTLRNLFGKMLSLDLGSLTPSSWTMAFSLTTNPLGYIVVNWELRTYILPQSILKETDKPKLLIRS